MAVNHRPSSFDVIVVDVDTDTLWLWSWSWLRMPVLDVRDGVTDYTKIILSTWAFSAESAEVFASAIARLPHLKSAILSDMIAGRPEAEGLRVYEVLGAALKDKQLTEIDLSDNAVGPKGVRACRELLTNQEHLEKLYFCNCGISAEAAVSIQELLLYRTPTRYAARGRGCGDGESTAKCCRPGCGEPSLPAPASCLCVCHVRVPQASCVALLQQHEREWRREGGCGDCSSVTSP